MVLLRTEPFAKGPRTDCNQRRGATIVEFAFIVPVFFLIVFGFIEVGRAIMVTHLLTNAARIGARTGAIEGVTTAQITSAVSTYLTTNGINGDSVTVQVNDGSTDASAAKSGDEITVLVTVPGSSVSWIPTSWTPDPKAGTAGYITNYTLSGQFTYRRE